MLSCVYRINFGKSSFDLNDEYDRLSDYEKEKISELDAESFFDCDDDNENYVCYVITSPLEIKSYLGILSNNLIIVKCDNLSKDILRGKVNLEEELRPQLSTINSVKYSFFIDELNEWIYNNLDLDTVLDRISESGMKSLTDTERLFLSNLNA
jgi:hypothetical protein